MNKIKVLHIHTLALISGSGINTFLTMAKINSDRYVSELACASSGRLIELVKSQGLKVRPIRNFTRPISPLKDILAVFELVSLIKKERYVIVHTHNSKAGFIGRLAAKIAGVPVIVHTVHGFAFHPYEKFWRRKIFIFLERLATRWCDVMIVISEAMVNWAVKERIVTCDKIVKIYSGIEIDKFLFQTNISAKRKAWGIKDDELVIGEVAKLWEGKGQDILLAAIPEIIREVSNLKVIFVGEGELEHRLKNIAYKLNIQDKIIFTGFRADIPEITSVFDIACLPTLWEGMGRSVLEAMVSGKPVVASRVGGIVDLVQDGVTGILVEPGDYQALAKAIIRLLKDKGLRQKMGEEARKRVDERFSTEKMVAEIEKIYNELLKKKGMLN
jgi:glycosyltransferase involved in cell wall biosynthesis